MLRIGAYTRREETDEVYYSIVPVVGNFAFVRFFGGFQDISSLYYFKRCSLKALIFINTNREHVLTYRQF